MINVSLGQAEGLEASDTVDRVIETCRRQLAGRRPSAGILYAGAGFDHQLILDRVNAAFPGMDLIGCTTAGNFSSTAGFSDNAVSLMVFASDTIEILAGLGRHLSKGYRSAAREALTMANDARSLPARVCLILPDLVNHAGGDIIAALSQEMEADCAIFGGSSAALDFTGQTIHQFFGREVLEDALPVLLFCGPVDYAYCIANSWKSVGPRETVTASNGRLVSRIGRRRALDFYFHYLGRHDDPATEFPLAVYPQGGSHFSLRAPMYYHPEEGAITFAESVPEGATVQLTEAYRDHLISDIGTSAQTLQGHLDTFQPFAALAFSCNLRKQALGTRTVEEIEALQRHYRTGLPILGFYSYGEIAPPAVDSESICHNATLVTLILGATEAAGPVENAIPRKSERTAFLEESSSMTTIFQALKKENAFLHQRLAQSEAYRRRLENIKELNAGLHRQIIEEVEAARREIAQREIESLKALRLAAEVQKNLLPRGRLVVDGIEVAGRNLPSQAIGGDYFDYLQHDPSCRVCLSVAVGDISGHGVDAALLMTSARGFLRTRVSQPGSGAEIVADMNRYLAADVLDSGRFMTLFFLSINPRAREIRWVRAGHDPALVYLPSQDRFEELVGEGLALGVDPDCRYTESVFPQLEKGQIVVIATDGISEARDRSGAMFGRERLQETIHHFRTESAERIVGHVFDAVARHSGDQPPEDDRTLVVVKAVETSG